MVSLLCLRPNLKPVRVGPALGCIVEVVLSTPKGIAERAGSFATVHGLSLDPVVRLLDVVAELGELASETLKSSNYDPRALVVDERWREEFGDLVFALSCLAYGVGISVEDVLDEAIAKYVDRMDGENRS